MKIPSSIRFHKKSSQLELSYGADNTYFLSAEFLRVHSPSAEVVGHSPDQKKLQYGKQNVGIRQIERQGNYALRIHFDDEHNTGIYTWDYLHYLASNKDGIWKIYLDELHRANKSRDPHEVPVQFVAPSGFR